MNEHKRMLQFCVYMKCITESGRSVERASSSDVFVHELAVEFGTDCVVDEVLLLSRDRTMKINEYFNLTLCN